MIPLAARLRTSRARISARQHHDAAPLRRRAGHLGLEPAFPGQCYQVFRERRRLAPHGVDSDLFQQFEAAQLRVHRHQRRRAALQPPGVVVQLERIGIETELLPVAEPARGARRQRRQQVGARIDERDAGAAQQPLEPAARIEVRVDGTHIDRYLPRCLVPVDQRQRPVPVRDRGDRCRILDAPAGEEDVARRHQCRPVVERALVQLERHPHAVGTLQHHDLDPVRHPRQPLVGNGREVERCYHHLGTPCVVQRLGDAGERGRNVGVQRDRSRRGADHPPIRRA